MTMTFAVEVRDPGSGFVLRIDEGASRVLPATSLDGRSWILTVDPAVSGGSVTITYDVFALDGHRVDGSVTVVTPVTETGAGTAPSSIIAAERDVETVERVDPGLARGVPDIGDNDSDRNVAAMVEHLGRLFVMAGTLVGVGLMVFGWGPARHRDVIMHSDLVTGAFIAVGMGALAEMIGVADRIGVSLVSMVTDPLGRASVMRVLAATVLVGVAVACRTGAWTLPRHVARRILAVGALVMVLAGGFDGHAVTQGPRSVHLVASGIHVGATALWVGAVIGLFLMRRSSRGPDDGVAQRVATLLVVTVAALAVTGVAMAALILDGPDGLGSPWGRILMTKLVAVTVAGVWGWRHHRALLRDGAEGLRVGSLSVEVCALAGAVLSTTWLVASMPS
jgi:putative copper export protein